MANYKSEFNINILHEVAVRLMSWDSRRDEYNDSKKWFTCLKKDIQTAAGSLYIHLDENGEKCE